MSLVPNQGHVASALALNFPNALIVLLLVREIEKLVMNIVICVVF